MRWKEFVTLQQQLRKAFGLFQNGLILRCFKKLALYREERQRGYEMKAFADEQWSGWRLKAGFSRLRSLISPERKEYKRQIANAMAWFRDTEKVKCFSLWVVYVKDIKKMRQALSIFKNGLLMRCFVKLKLYNGLRLFKREAKGRGDDLFRRNALTRCLRTFRSSAMENIDLRRRLASSMSWFVNSTLKRCFITWVENVDLRKKLRWVWRAGGVVKLLYPTDRENFPPPCLPSLLSLRFAVSIFNQSCIVRVWIAWELYVVRKSQSVEAKTIAYMHWRASAMRKALSRFGVNTKESLKTKQLLVKARHWFSDIMLYKTFYVWVDFLTDAKGMRKAVSMLSNNMLFKCFTKWTIYVKEAFAERMVLSTASRLWNLILEGKSFRTWKLYWIHRKEKREREREAEEWRLDRLVKKGIRRWSVFAEVRQGDKTLETIGNTHWREKCGRRFLLDLIENAVHKKRLRKAFQVCNHHSCWKIFHAWVFWKNVKLKNRKKMEEADVFYVENLARKSIKELRRWNQAKKFNRVKKEIANEHYYNR